MDLVTLRKLRDEQPPGEMKNALRWAILRIEKLHPKAVTLDKVTAIINKSKPC